MKSFLQKSAALFLVIIMLVSIIPMGAFAASRKLDLAFVIDTTGSMSDDIATVKRNMKEYLNSLADTGMNFKIAIIDYRDFAEHTGNSVDYPYCVQLDFSSDRDVIIDVINSLRANGGGDTPETLCSALIDGLDELSWRSDAGKAVIVMGDAPAHDPEPISGYTKAQALSKLKYDSLAYDEEFLESSTKKLKSAMLKTDADVLTPNNDDSSISNYATEADSNVTQINPETELNVLLDQGAVAKPVMKAKANALMGSKARSSVTLFAIATSSNSSTTRDFKYLSEKTGGEYYKATNSSAITDSIKEIIEIIPETVETPKKTFWDRIMDVFHKITDIFTFKWLKFPTC